MFKKIIFLLINKLWLMPKKKYISVYSFFYLFHYMIFIIKNNHYIYKNEYYFYNVNFNITLQI